MNERSKNQELDHGTTRDVKTHTKKILPLLEQSVLQGRLSAIEFQIPLKEFHHFTQATFSNCKLDLGPNKIHSKPQTSYLLLGCPTELNKEQVVHNAVLIHTHKPFSGTA